jgi:uncharacterized protein (TIGR02266 family)
LSSDPPISPLTDDELRKRRVPLQRKISLKFKEFRGFITEHSANISMGGMFIRTDTPQPPGTIFDFEFTLGDGYTLIHGIGEVVWVREADEGPDRPPGMGVRFLNLDPESRQLVDRIVLERLRREGASGLPSSPGPEPWEAPPAITADLPDDDLEEVEPESWNMGEAPVPVPTSPAAPSEPHAFRLFDEPDDALDGELPTEALVVPDTDRPDTDTWEIVADDPEEPADEDGEDFSDEAILPGEDEDEAGGEDDGWALSEPPANPVAGDGRDGDEAFRVDFDDTPAPATPPAGVVVPPSGTPAPRPAAGERVPLAYSRSRAGSVPPGKRSSRRPLLLFAALALVVLAVALFLLVPSSPRDQLLASLGFAGGEDTALAGETPADTPAPAVSQAVEQDAGEGAADPTPGVLAVADGEGNVRQVERDEPPPTVAETPREEPLADPIPASGPFGRLLGITWQGSGDRTVVILQLDGKIEEWSYSTAALSAPPRVLVRLEGAKGRYAGGAAEVGDSQVERVRVGYHPGAAAGTADDELHVVVDLAAPGIRLATTDATGAELRLVFSSGAGDG